MFFIISFYISFFQQKFVLRGGSVLNELPEVPDTNLLPFDENLDGGQQFDVENIVVHPKFNPFTYEHDIALVRNIWFFSPLVPSKLEKNILVLLRLYIF